MADKCFVLLPFKKPFTDYYREIIAPAVKEAGFVPFYAEEIYGARAIIEDIFNGIREAAILVADVTGRNPNVNYELGIAHAFGRRVVLISQSMNDVPFDYHHLRIIIYDTSEVLWETKLKMKIKETILKLSEDTDTLESYLATRPVYFSIVNKRSDKCLDVQAWDKNNGARIQQFAYHGGDNQIWALRPGTDQYFYIISKHGRKYLDVEDASVHEGARIQQWEYVGGSNQQWKFDKLEDGSYRIVARHSGKCMNVQSGSYEDSAPVVQYTWHGGENQRWWLRLLL